MNFKSKLIIGLKSILIWWGIFLILGCCAGFAYKTIWSMLEISESTDIIDANIFIPLFLAGTFLAAIFFHILKQLFAVIPIYRIKIKFNKALKQYGVSQQYINFLFENSKGVLKNRLLLEACLGYTLLGMHENADELLDKIDLNSIIDDANATGDVYNAAIYYCERMLNCFFRNDMENFDKYYSEAEIYFKRMGRNYRVKIVTALYWLTKGEYQKGIDCLYKVSTGNPFYFYNKYSFAAVYAMRGALYLEMGNVNEAEVQIRTAIEYPVTDFYDSYMGKMLIRCKSMRESQIDNKDTSK